MLRLAVSAALLAAASVFSTAAAENATAQSISTMDANGTTHEVYCGVEKQESGYIELSNRVDTHYFYWYFESRNEPSTDPLILWLPGGPGEGGEYGVLAENGPCTVNDDLSTTINAYSWNTYANVLWIDIPANSGFSYSTTAEDDEFTEERVDDSVYWFLQGFFEKHTELQGRELYIIGESMGGHYVPAVAHHLWKRQHETLFTPGCADTIPVNLKGIAVGNGFTDPTEVNAHYGSMAVNNYNITLVNDTQLAAMKEAEPECRALMNECQSNTTVCGTAYEQCTNNLMVPVISALRNPYDIRQECGTSYSDMVACLLKIPNVKKYLDSPALRDFLGVNPNISEWTMVNLTINNAFFSPPEYSALISVVPQVGELLDAGVHVLMYAGDADLMCNVYATEATADKIEWSGAVGFNVSESRMYSTASGLLDVARVRSYSRLTFLEVFNAGHMVPGDQPEVALDFVTKLIRNEPFDDSPARL